MENKLMAVDESMSTGSVMFWTMHSDTPFGALVEALEEIGVPKEDAPHQPTPLRALHRACGTLPGRDLLVRPLTESHHEDGEDKEGYAILHRTKIAGKVAFVTEVEAWLAPAGNLPYDPDPLLAKADGTEPDEEVIEVIVLAYRHERAHLAHSDVSAWLISLVKRHGGIALRESGSVYWVPRDAIAYFRRIKGVLATLGAGSVYEVPALHGAQAVEAVMAALAAEAEEEIGKLDAALNEGELGKRALASRAERAARVDAKLRAYEETMGEKLEGLRERIAALGANLMSASLRAEVSA